MLNEPTSECFWNRIQPGKEAAEYFGTLFVGEATAGHETPVAHTTNPKNNAAPTSKCAVMPTLNFKSSSDRINHIPLGERVDVAASPTAVAGPHQDQQVHST